MLECGSGEFPVVDVAGAEVAGGDAEGEGLARVPGEVGRGAQFKEAVDAGERKGGAERNLDAFTEGERPHTGDLVAEVRDGAGEEFRRGIEREGELIFGLWHGGEVGGAAGRRAEGGGWRARERGAGDALLPLANEEDHRLRLAAFFRTGLSGVEQWWWAAAGVFSAMSAMDLERGGQ